MKTQWKLAGSITPWLPLAVVTHTRSALAGLLDSLTCPPGTKFVLLVSSQGACETPNEAALVPTWLDE